MKKQKILAYEGRIPVSDRELTAAVIDIDNKKHLIIDLYIARTIKYRMAKNMHILIMKIKNGTVYQLAGTGHIQES